MASLEVIYENGILRPLRPLELAEGTRLEVIMITIAPPAAPHSPPSPSPEQLRGQAQVDEAMYVGFLHRLDSIAALPLQSSPQPHIAHDHDAILYPKQGTMP